MTICERSEGSDANFEVDNVEKSSSEQMHKLVGTFNPKVLLTTVIIIMTPCVLCFLCTA